MKPLSLFDPIWIVRGAVPLVPGQGVDDAFARLDGLFQAHGTTRWRDGNVLHFVKQGALAQDKMAIYDSGRLTIVGGVLAYVMASRALLFCLLAAPFFLGLSYCLEGSEIAGKVFAALFVVLYAIGRWLEPRLIARLFARRLAGQDDYRPPELQPTP